MNQVALVGNITDDPELRYTQSGAALAGFTVAVSHRSKHNGQWQDVNDVGVALIRRDNVARDQPRLPSLRIVALPLFGEAGAWTDTTVAPGSDDEEKRSPRSVALAMRPLR